MSDVVVRGYRAGDIPAMMKIWNDIVAGGQAFPEETCFTLTDAEVFFDRQSYCGVAEVSGEIVGLSIVHPNSIGRCGHIANASYAVDERCRGKSIGERLVRDSLTAATELGFRLMQFNAVVASNEAAIRLYEKIGFTRLGTIPGGFRRLDGTYVDIIPFVIPLVR